MLVTIDRFEGEFAVCELEDMSFASLPMAFVPAGAAEGSKLNISLDLQAQQVDAARIEAKMDRLFND